LIDYYYLFLPVSLLIVVFGEVKPNLALTAGKQQAKAQKSRLASGGVD
jgi:hypothetical protein